MTDSEAPTGPTEGRGATAVPRYEQDISGNAFAGILAGVYAVFAIIAAIVLLSNANTTEYGGDAYTGIQHAIVWAVRGIAFLLIGSGVLGVLLVLRGRPI